MPDDDGRGGIDLPVRALPAGPWRSDCSCRDGHVVPLTPKAFDLLVYLVEHQGRLVEKSALMAALWPDTIVEEANLAFQIPRCGRRWTMGRRRDADPDRADEGLPVRGSCQRRVRLRPASSGSPRRIVSHSPGGCGCMSTSHRRPFPQGRKRTTPPASRRVVQLTTQTGVEFHPAFSPDGTQVVYPAGRLGGSGQHESGLWQTVVGSTDVRQLTTGRVSM